jgi:hypothetical protein
VVLFVVVVVAHASSEWSSSGCESQRASRRLAVVAAAIAHNTRRGRVVVNGWAEAVRLRKVGQLYHRACAWVVARDGDAMRCYGTG